MTTALDRLRSMVGAARRDSLIATAEADILDRLVRVVEDEDDERLDGALEELADNLRRVLDKCVDRDDDDNDCDDNDCDDLPSALRTGVSAREACRRRMPLDGADAQALEGALSMTERERDEARAEVERFRAERDEWIDVAGRVSDLLGGGREIVADRAKGVIMPLLRGALLSRDEARAEIGRLRAEVASLRERPTRDELADYARRMRADDAPDADEPDDGWEPGPWWKRRIGGSEARHPNLLLAAHVYSHDGYWRGNVWTQAGMNGRSCGGLLSMTDAQRWCEAQPEMDAVRAAYTSAPTVGATDAGPDAPAPNVEGDAAEGAPLEGAVPAAPVSTAEQRDGETGVDRPSTSDERIVGPREGEDWIGQGRHAGTSPYGYDVDTSGDDPVLLTNQVEADTMLLLCEWRDAGVSAQTMAKRLNDIGRRTRSGCVWTASSVRSRLLSSGSGYDEWHEVGR